LSRSLLDALDPDAQHAAAQAQFSTAEPTPEQVAQAAASLVQDAANRLADNPPLRHKLLELQRAAEQVIDTVTQDQLLDARFDADATTRARATVESFETFIQEHKDEISALQLLYSRP